MPLWENADGSLLSMTVAEKKRSRGRPKKGEEKKTSAAQQIKGAKYSLGKVPENLTENQKVKLEMISKSQPELYSKMSA